MWSLSGFPGASLWKPSVQDREYQLRVWDERERVVATTQSSKAGGSAGLPVITT